MASTLKGVPAAPSTLLRCMLSGQFFGGAQNHHWPRGTLRGSDTWPLGLIPPTHLGAFPSAALWVDSQECLSPWLQCLRGGGVLHPEVALSGGDPLIHPLAGLQSGLSVAAMWGRLCPRRASQLLSWGPWTWAVPCGKELVSCPLSLFSAVLSLAVP